MCFLSCVSPYSSLGQVIIPAKNSYLHRCPDASFAGHKTKHIWHSQSCPCVSGGSGSLATWPSTSLAVLADGAIETASSSGTDIKIYLVASVSVRGPCDCGGACDACLLFLEVGNSSDRRSICGVESGLGFRLSSVVAWASFCLCRAQYLNFRRRFVIALVNRSVIGSSSASGNVGGDTDAASCVVSSAVSQPAVARRSFNKSTT